MGKGVCLPTSYCTSTLSLPPPSPRSFRTRSFNTDMFSSAAVVVTPSGGTDFANARVYLSTTKGGIYCYSALNVNAGPLWTTYGEIGRVPDAALPESTYSYMTITATGTILVTAPAAGDLWSSEKVRWAGAVRG